MSVAIFPVLMVGAIYLLLWRPQQKRISAVRRLQNEIKEGDEVLTTSGIYGTIVRLGESELGIAVGMEVKPGLPDQPASSRARARTGMSRGRAW